MANQTTPDARVQQALKGLKRHHGFLAQSDPEDGTYSTLPALLEEPAVEALVGTLLDQLETERIVSASRLGTRSIDVAVIEAYQAKITELDATLATLRDTQTPIHALIADLSDVEHAWIRQRLQQLLAEETKP